MTYNPKTKIAINAYNFSNYSDDTSDARPTIITWLEENDFSELSDKYKMYLNDSNSDTTSKDESLSELRKFAGLSN